MPSLALVELLHRVEATIREYSEELISQLARREELEFEKEVKNTFITALMEVQNRQKEQRESGKRRRRDKALSLQGGTNPTEKTGSMPAKVTHSNCPNRTLDLLTCSVLSGPILQTSASLWRTYFSVCCIHRLKCSRSGTSIRSQVKFLPLLLLLPIFLSL